MASAQEVQLQDDLLAVGHLNRSALAERELRLVHMSASIGALLASTAIDDTEHPVLKNLVSIFVERSNIAAGHLNLPECPSLVANVLRLAWDVAVSEDIHCLTISAFGVESPRLGGEPVFLERCRPGAVLGYMPGTRPAGFEEVVTAGARLRALMTEHGLRAHHVPQEVRYVGDAFVLGIAEYHWRRHACLYLRNWLQCLELTNEIFLPRSEWSDSVASARLRATFAAQRNHLEHSVYHFGIEDAAIMVAHMLGLATELAEWVDYLDENRRRTNVSPELIGLAAALAPYPNRPVHVTRVAQYWLWLDEVAGRDAYGFWPSCPPDELIAFDRALDADDRRALRAHRDRTRRGTLADP